MPSCLLWCPVSPVLPLQVRAKLKRLDIFLHQSPPVYLQNLILHYIFIRKDLYHLLDHFGAAILTRGSLKNPGSIGKITPPRTAAHRVHCATVKLCNCATVHLCSAYIQDSQIILKGVLCLIIWEAYIQRWTPADKIRFQICIWEQLSASSRGKHDWCKFRRGLNDASFYFAPRDLSRSVIIVKTSFEARPTDETCFGEARLRDFFSSETWE